MTDHVYKQYQRTVIVEMRALEGWETPESLKKQGVSVSAHDMQLDELSFGLGKVARNPQTPTDEWYMAYDYFVDNFEELHKEQI